MANGAFVSPQTAWWPVAVRRDVALPTGAVARAHYSVLPGGLDRGEVWLLLLAGAASVLVLGLRRPFDPADGLRLLAALMLARVLLDPFEMPYYGLPLAFAILAMARRDTRAAAAAAGVLVGLHLAGLSQPAGSAFALTAAWAVPTGLVLALGAPRLPRPAGPRVRAA